VRRIAVAALLLLSSCAAPTTTTPVRADPEQAPRNGETDAQRTARIQKENLANYERQMADIRSRPDHLSGIPAQAPTSASSPRENELLERALTNSPDYAQALRRAAIANVDAEGSPSVRRQPSQVREQRISAEEARLSDVIEKRRRERLAQRRQQDRAAQAAAIRANCDAQASAVGAGTYTPYSPRAGILGSALSGAINSTAAEEQARAGCYRAYGL
jgi:hypothetical protein